MPSRQTADTNHEKSLEQLCLEASRETDLQRKAELIEEIDRLFDGQHKRKRELNRALGYEE